MQMVGGVIGPQDLETRAPQIRGHRLLGEVVRVIDLDCLLDRPVAQIRRTEVDDVDEEEAFQGEQMTNAFEDAMNVEQVIDRLTDQHQIKPARAEVMSLDQSGDRFQTEAACFLDFERCRVDQRGLQPELLREMVRHHARGSADVEQGPQRRALEKWPREPGTFDGVLSLLALDGLRIDRPAMKRADERPVDAVIEARVCGRRHPRVEKHQTARGAGVRFGGKAIAIAMGDHHERRAAAQVARGDRFLRLRGIVVGEGSDPLRPIRRDGHRHQYVNRFSMVSAAVARQSAIRWPARPSPYR
jgi:hypothetical protein